MSEEGAGYEASKLNPESVIPKRIEEAAAFRRSSRIAKKKIVVPSKKKIVVPSRRSSRIAKKKIVVPSKKKIVVLSRRSSRIASRREPKIQGKRHVFFVSTGGNNSLATSHVLDDRITLDQVEIKHTVCFIENNQLITFKPGLLCCYCVNNSWQLGAVANLIPSELQIMKLSVNADGQYRKVGIEDDLEKDIQLVYVNRVREELVSNVDNKLSMSTDGPDCVDMKGGGKASGLWKIYPFETSNMFTLPKSFSGMQTGLGRKKCKASQAKAGALFVKTQDVRDIKTIPKEGTLFEMVPTEKERKAKKAEQGSEQIFCCLGSSEAEGLIQKMMGGKVMKISEYNKHLEKLGQRYHSKLYRSTDEGIMFGSKKNCYKKNPSKTKAFQKLGTPKEHFELSSFVTMHAIRARKKTFEIEEKCKPDFFHMFKHFLNGFSFNRGCSQGKSINYHCGCNQAACVRPTPNKEKSTTSECLYYRQSFVDTCGPLVNMFLRQLTDQATKCDASFDPALDALQAVVLMEQATKTKVDVWRFAKLTILTICFYNKLHKDKHDLHGTLFDELAGAFIKKWEAKWPNGKIPPKEKSMLRHFKHFWGLRNFGKSTTCGYRIFRPKDLGEKVELFATFTNVSTGISVLIEDEMCVWFIGSQDVHCTSVPLLVDHGNGTVRLAEEDDIITFAWGAGKSAARVHLEGHGHEIRGKRLSQTDIQNFVRVLEDAQDQEKMSDVKSQTWFREDLHNPHIHNGDEDST